MRIISWNCNMAFRKKAQWILPYQPDIVVVPECEHPDKIKFPEHTKKPNQVLWFGTNPHKGIGIFTYGNYKCKLLPGYNASLRFIIPLKVTGPQINLNLFAVWAHNPTDPDGRYVEQVWKAIDYYKRHIRRKKTILTGDFNSNAIWDKEHKNGNHSDIVKKLASKNIQSAYHLHYQQVQGQEKAPTLYLYRHQHRPYHLDYCFLSEDLASELQSVEIGDFKYWTRFSDHVPIITTINTNNLNKK